jgi:uncharacterized protein YndB with AHSA1/START domain
MARQTSIIASAIIPAPPERVWEIACDTSRYPEWVENTLRMIHGRARPGRRNHGGTHPDSRTLEVGHPVARH